MSTTLEQLIAQVEADRQPVAEIFTKLPELLTGGENDDVVFNVTPPVTFPSIAKLEAGLAAAGLTTAQTRQTNLENAIQGLIQQTTQISSALEQELASPYWSKLDLSSSSSPDINPADPLFRCRIENGIRFDYDAFHPVQLTRQFDTDGKIIGDWLLPTHTESAVNLYTSALPASGDTGTTQENTAKYNAFQKEIKTYEREFKRYYYGGYYKWYRRYWGIATTSYIKEKVTTVSQSIENSLAAQTFKLDEERILLGVNLLVKNPGGTKGTANPGVYLTRTSLGMPVLDEILATGSLYDDANAASSNNAVLVRFNFGTPVLLRAGTSYALVIKAANGSTWNVWYNSNEHGKGSIFFTQDGSYWHADLAKDFIIQLITCNFSTTTSVTIPMGNMSVSGGIASINQNEVVEIPETVASDISFQVETVSGNWTETSILNQTSALPANVNIRAIFTGTQYAMPLVDTRNSVMTGFRPAVNLVFASTTLTVPNTESLRVIYNLSGFDETETGSGPMHTFSPQVKMSGSYHNPVSMTVHTSDDNAFTKVEAIYTIPVGVTEYSHYISATTLSANNTFDIISIVQLNQ